MEAPVAEAPPGPRDADAMKDYGRALYGGLGAPERSLLRALKTCQGGCSPRVLALIHIALGTLEGGLKGRMDEAESHFMTALRLDPSAHLDEDLTTPELDAAFDAARKRVASDAAH
jgi:hypothetical protein